MNCKLVCSMKEQGRHIYITTPHKRRKLNWRSIWKRMGLSIRFSSGNQVRFAESSSRNLALCKILWPIRAKRKKLMSSLYNQIDLWNLVELRPRAPLENSIILSIPKAARDKRWRRQAWVKKNPNCYQTWRTFSWITMMAVLLKINSSMKTILLNCTRCSRNRRTYSCRFYIWGSANQPIRRSIQMQSGSLSSPNRLSPWIEWKVWIRSEVSIQESISWRCTGPWRPKAL